MLSNLSKIIDALKRIPDPFEGIQASGKAEGLWLNIINELDRIAVNGIKKGDNVATLVQSAATLSLEVGSFIPGPIGIVCNIVLAIQCIAVGNIPGAGLALLSCIPGAKLVAGSRKLVAGSNKLIKGINPFKGPANLINQINYRNILNAIKEDELVVEFVKKVNFIKQIPSKYRKVTNQIININRDTFLSLTRPQKGVTAEDLDKILQSIKRDISVHPKKTNITRSIEKKIGDEINLQKDDKKLLDLYDNNIADYVFEQGKELAKLKFNL